MHALHRHRPADEPGDDHRKIGGWALCRLRVLLARGLRFGRLAVSDGPAPEQSVAPARGRLQHASIRAKRLADRGYVNVKRIFPDDGARPDTLHQIVFGDELTCRPGQDFDDLERAVAEGYWRAA
jgi:hypothetical protein